MNLEKLVEAVREYNCLWNVNKMLKHFNH